MNAYAPIRKATSIARDYERATRGRWVSGIYSFAGNARTARAKRTIPAREPGPVTVMNPVLDAKLGQLLQQVCVLAQVRG